MAQIVHTLIRRWCGFAVAVMVFIVLVDPFSDSASDADADDWIPEQHLAIVDRTPSLTIGIAVRPFTKPAETIAWDNLNSSYGPIPDSLFPPSFVSELEPPPIIRC